MVKIVDDAQLEQLLKAAGKQYQPDPAMVEAIRQSTEDAWLDAVAQHQRRQKRALPWRWISASAAAMVAIIGFFLINPPLQTPAPVFANVTYHQGAYQVNKKLYSADAALNQGDTISSAVDGVMTLRLIGGATVTLAANTQLRIDDRASMTLLNGKVYVDSPKVESRIVVGTAWGKIEDIGTQFEITVDPAQLRVAMREGKVKMALEGSTHFANFENGIGDVITVNKKNDVEKTTLASNDEYWNWPMPALASLRLEGQSLHQLMDWVERTTGKPVIYQTPVAEQKAKQTQLSGGELAPSQISESLPFILKTTSLAAEITANRIEISLSSKN